MPTFHDLIHNAHPTPADIAARRWIYIPYDRFTDRTGPLTDQPASATGIVIVESTAKALRRPYHKKKLIVLISNMRHFALEQAALGCKVIYHFSDQSHGQALLALQRKLRLPALTVMEPAERELRLDLAQATTAGLQLISVPDTTWLSTTDDFTAVYGSFRPGKSYVMDRFYRRMRQQTGILMDPISGHKPIGGKFSFDEANRNPYKGQVPIPTPPTFPPDDLTQEVIAHVEALYPHHFGTSHGFDLPVTQADCDAMWAFALEQLLPTFGPYEDAMRDDHLQLFHSRTSAFINLGRLLPADLIRDVAAAAVTSAETTSAETISAEPASALAPKPSIPLASAEGFIRQILGWREFMRHLHQQTDGYRLLPPKINPPSLKMDAAQTPHPATKTPSRKLAATAPPNTPYTDPYAGANPNALDANLPLPAAYWGVKSGLHCLDTVVDQVIQEGWSHHITRLMVLSNLATLCGFSARELTDWFWFAYVDAYDWVVETNVLGMATYSDGGLTATKPYISGSAYINKMSNYCGHCQYDPKKSTGPGSCPFTALYWTFLERHQETLGSNFRLQMPYTTLRRKSPQDLVQLRTRADEAIAHLQSFPRPAY